jgi:hypothetical protein
LLSPQLWREEELFQKPREYLTDLVMVRQLPVLVLQMAVRLLPFAGARIAAAARAGVTLPDAT